MTQTQNIFRNGFFAFLAMILVAVGTALVLNAPPETSRAAVASSDRGEDYAPAESDSRPVMDAHLETDTPAT